MTRSTSLALFLALLLLAPRPGAAQDDSEKIGSINRPPQPEVSIIRNDTQRDAEVNADILVGTRLLTKGKGIAELFLRHRVGDKQNVAILPNSNLLVRRGAPKDGGRYVFQLDTGALRWVGEDDGNDVVEAGPQGTVRAFGTAFIASYDPATRTATIVGISGEVSVSNRIVGGQVSVRGHQRTMVVDGKRPTTPTLLSEADFQRYVRPFELMGHGKAESQVVGDPVVAGADVPDKDRAPMHGPLPVDDAPRERAPFFEQPLPAVGSTDIRVPF